MRCCGLTSRAASESSAFFVRSREAMPESTDQLCAIESIWHSTPLAVPSGVPSSNQARRYHSPSQAFTSMATASLSRASVQVCAKASSWFERARAENSRSTSQTKKPIHTLSPLPCSPIRFMPSFQSPPPISGRPCTPMRSPCLTASMACSYSVAVRCDTLGMSK